MIRDAFQWLEAGQEALAAALLRGDHDELVAAVEHSIRCTEKAVRSFSLAVHVDPQADR